MTHYLNYFSQADWERFDASTTSHSQRRWMVMDLLNKLGVSSLDEQIVSWAVALILHFTHVSTNTWPSYQNIHAIVKDFKRDYEAMKAVAKRQNE